MNKVKEDIKEEYQKYEVDGVESTDSPPIVATFLKFIPYNERQCLWNFICKEQ